MANILGLVDNTVRTIDMFNTIVSDFNLSRYISKQVGQDIQNSLINDHYKIIDPLLEPFVGVYNIDDFKMPKWWDEFKLDYIKYLSDNVRDEIADDYAGNKGLDETKKMIQIIKQLNNTTVEHLRESKLPNGHRIIKALKKIIELCCTKGLVVEDTSWYKTYESKKVVINDLQLVITNSAPTQIGMSSYFENPSYSSCQTFYKSDYGQTYCKGLWSNIMDKSSLIMYVTRDGKITDFYGAKKWTHQSMITRYMLKLVTVPEIAYKCNNCSALYEEEIGKCKECGYTSFGKRKQKPKTGVVIDRAYPHAEYSPAVFKIIKKLCDEQGLDLLYFADYKVSQDSERKVDGVKVNDAWEWAFTKNPIMYTKLKDYDKNCQTCSSYKKLCGVCHPVFGQSSSNPVCTPCPYNNTNDRICSACSRTDVGCIGKDCFTCEKNSTSCRQIENIYKSYYDDHMGGANVRKCTTTGDSYVNVYKMYQVTEVR